MNPVFLDTSGLVAVANVSDQWHGQAVKAWARLIDTSRPLLTTSLVLIELADGLASVRQRQLAISIVDRLNNSSKVEVVKVSREIETEAWALYRQRPDKEWGMTDCVSMIVMKMHGVQEVFTADKHFLQAGYNVLLDP